MPRVSLAGLVLCALLAAGEARALSSDKDQPIRIEADSVVIDDGRGIATYRGNVHYSQGSAQLRADEVVVYSADRKQVDKVVATGAPASFRQRPDNKDEDIRGEARRIDYFATEGRIVLEGDGHLFQGQNEFAGDRIEYQIGAEVVKALRAPDSGARVQVIIQPRKNGDGAAAPSAPEPRP